MSLARVCGCAGCAECAGCAGWLLSPGTASWRGWAADCCLLPESVELRAGCSLSLPTSRDYQRQTDAEFFREKTLQAGFRPWQLVHALSTHAGSLLEKSIPSSGDASKWWRQSPRAQEQVLALTWPFNRLLFLKIYLIKSFLKQFLMSTVNNVRPPVLFWNMSLRILSIVFQVMKKEEEK